MSKHIYRFIIPKILDCSQKSYYRWKEEKRPIIAFLESFSVEELEEFLTTNNISAISNYRNFSKTKEGSTYKLFLKFLEFQSHAYNEVKKSDVKRLEDENTSLKSELENLKSLKSELENLKQKLALFQKIVNEPL